MPWDTLKEDKQTNWVTIGHLPVDRSGDITRYLIRQAHQVGIPVSWVPGGTQIHCKAGSFADTLRQLRLLTLNLEEAIAFFELPRDVSPVDAIYTVAPRVGEHTIVAVTDGGRSPAVCWDNKHQRLYEVPPLSVPVVDATGAGDAFHAGLIAGLLKGMELEAALELARWKAASVCTVWGGCGLMELANKADFRPPSPTAPVTAVALESM